MFRAKLLLLCVLFSGISSAQIVNRFDSLFQSYHSNGLFEGTALIADSNGIVYHKGFGVANRENNILNDTSTVFRIGSLEKQFTAMLVLQLVELGKINLDAKISSYLPEYRKETGSKVSVRHLLTHTSGIPSYTALPNVWSDSMQLSYPPQYILRNFCSGNLEFKPGAKYKYSNTDYFILALIIERVTQKRLSVVLKQNILDPVGMTASGLDDNITPVKNKAQGYYRLGGDYRNEPYIYVPNVLGAASMFSTAHDLFLWDRALYTDKLLSYDLLRTYSTSQFRIAPDYGYGFGWEFTNTSTAGSDSLFTMEHSGAIRAFRSIIFRIPGEKKCVILLSNCGNQSAYSLFENITEIFRRRQWKAPAKLLADTLYNVMQHRSIEGGIQLYKALKKANPKSFDFSSVSLEFLGERLFEFRNFEAAAAIFSLAVDEFPNYTAGYYYLGKAYEKSGRIGNAIKAYQMAVTKDKLSRAGVDAAFQIKYLKARRIQ